MPQLKVDDAIGCCMIVISAREEKLSKSHSGKGFWPLLRYTHRQNMSTRCIYIALCVYAKLQNIKVAFLSRLNGMTVYIKDCLHKRSNMNRITTPCGPRGMGMWVLKVINAKFWIRPCPFHVQRIFCTVCVSRVLCLTLDCQTYCAPNTANTVMICVLSISLFVYLSLKRMQNKPYHFIFWKNC